MKPTKATTADYIVLQGGKPKITQTPDGLYHIQHQYREDEPEVITHISPQARGTVIIRDIEYQVACLWQFERRPCEAQSRRVGGDRYPRKE